MVTAAGVDADVPAADPMVPDKPNELEAENWGGVIASTAPRPPKVPPAINNARFISCPRFETPRRIYMSYISRFT